MAAWIEAVKQTDNGKEYTQSGGCDDKGKVPAII